MQATLVGTSHLQTSPPTTVACVVTEAHNQGHLKILFTMKGDTCVKYWGLEELQDTKGASSLPAAHNCFNTDLQDSLL